jgi:hypothetical protein
MGTVEITDFQISIRDVIFKISDDNADTSDIAFRGPFALDLLNGADAIAETIGNVAIPFGTYEEVRLKFHKDEDSPSSDPLYDRSIFIAGTIDGVPFEMWHDTSENLDIEKSGGFVIGEGELALTIDFSLSQFLNSEHQIDLSEATDGNEDGLIEINPNDPDGNKDIADDLKDNIKAAADLLEH